MGQSINVHTVCKLCGPVVGSQLWSSEMLGLRGFLTVERSFSGEGYVCVWVFGRQIGREDQSAGYEVNR